MAELMTSLGHDQFHLHGEDRGAEFTYVLAATRPSGSRPSTSGSPMARCHVEDLALWKRASAEFGAVFLLASIGPMTVATAITTGAYGLFELSIAFGFAITVMVVVSGAVSGAHFNPAITITLASFRRFPWRDVPVYIAAQISGGVVGALVLSFFFSGPTGDPDTRW